MSRTSEEWLELLSADGVATGEKKLKRLVHRDGDWHRTAHLWIGTPGGEVLLQRRALVKENYGGYWDVAVAGHVSAGETAATAIVREAFEELGIGLREEELEKLGSVKEECVLNEGKYIDRELHEIFAVRREVNLATLVLQREEVEGVVLIPAGELARRIQSGDPTLVPHGAEHALVLDWLRDLNREAQSLR
ncbi:MAG: NUDIX domain-containing protein [Acidobacteriota bacterium]